MESFRLPPWGRWALALTAGLFVAVLAWLMLKEDPGLKMARPKVGFVIIGDVAKPGWNAANYEGIRAACDKMGADLLVRDQIPESTGQCRKAVQELAADGANMIFLASYAYPAEVQDLTQSYPEIAFATVSAEAETPNMTAYFPRLYQARYLSGALAALETKSGILGYVGAMQNSEVCRGINAFALGARRINPNVRVLVTWTDSWQDADRAKANAERLIAAGADVLTYHQNEADVADVAEAHGVDFIGYQAPLEGYSDHNLTSVVCRWDAFYSVILRRYLRGELNAAPKYWVGIDQGVVGLSPFSPKVTPEMALRLDSMLQELVNNRLIFSGVLKDTGGFLRCEAGEAISDAALLDRMNWLVEGVEVLGP